LAKVGGCPFSDWVRWEAKLVREGSEEGGLAENLVMAGSFLTITSEQAKYNATS
jgi:hypothetical protein